jgi:hypothetical protein
MCYYKACARESTTISCGRAGLGHDDDAFSSLIFEKMQLDLRAAAGEVLPKMAHDFPKGRGSDSA